MSMDPSKIHIPIDLFSGTGTTTGTQAGAIFGLPPGKKAVAIALVTSATVTVKVQASVDKTNFFDVVITTNTSVLAEVDSVVPFWRVNVTSHSTSGTGSNAAMAAAITQAPT